MSTILKALRRLEDDKRAEETRSLDQAVLEPAAPVRSARGRRTRAVAGVMAAAGVIAIAWSFADPSSSAFSSAFRARITSCTITYIPERGIVCFRFQG